MKMACFRSECFYDQPCSSVPCHIGLLLERSVQTDKNGIYFIEICSYFMNISPLNPRTYFTTCREDKIGLKFVTFLSFQLFENVIYHFIRIYATFQMVH